MKKLIVATGISLLFLSACTITQKFEFKEDWSGTYSMDIDMSEMTAMLGGGGEDDTTASGEKAGDELGLKESLGEISKIDGITDVFYEEDEKNGRYKLSYKFRDIDALNRSLVGNGVTKELAPSDHLYFSLDGAKLTYTMPALDDGGEESGAGMAGMDDMMMDMIKFKLHFQFDKGVKKAKSKQLKKGLSKDDNSVRWDPHFKDVMALEGLTSITISVNK